MDNNLISISSVDNNKIAKYSSDNIKKSLILAKKLSSPDQDAKYYFDLGWEKLRMSDYQEAFNCFDRAIQIDSLYADAYSKRADMKKILGDYQGAIDDFTQAIILDPEKSHFHYFSRGIVKKEIRDYQDAINDFTRNISITPGKQKNAEKPATA
jgi:tetratricopeptide (TPR) repeat protein